MSATGRSLRDRNRARVRAEIVSAARRLFLRYGYAATSVEQVAEAAGVSPRTVFRHFPRKEDLVFHRHAEEIGRFRRLLDEQPPERPALDALLDALLGLLQLERDEAEPDGGQLLELLDREPELARRDELLVADHHAAVLGFLRGRLARAGGRGATGGAKAGGARGDLGRTAEQRAELLAGCFMGALHAARRLVLVQPQTPPREHLAAAIEMLRALDWPEPASR